MYECCLHTLRVLLLRIGWVSAAAAADLHYAPVLGVASALRCQRSGHARHAEGAVSGRVEEIGYHPEPYVLATASMFADDKHVVQMDGMSVELRGLTRRALELEWGRAVEAPARPAFNRAQIVAYAEGNPSECFGEPIAPSTATAASRACRETPTCSSTVSSRVEAPQWVLQPGGWVTCAFDVAPDAWYFQASRQRTMPFAVLLEAALQPCGWLAAYVGSALTSDVDLHFRNLDGHGTQLAEVGPDAGTLTTRAGSRRRRRRGHDPSRSSTSRSSGARSGLLRQTGFGFFPAAALADQVGLRGRPPGSRAGRGPYELRGVDRLPRGGSGVSKGVAWRCRAAALSMIDRIEVLDLTGGPAGLGFVVGTKRVQVSGRWLELSSVVKLLALLTRNQPSLRSFLLPLHRSDPAASLLFSRATMNSPLS